MSGEIIELLGDAGATSTARREEDTPPGHQEAGDAAESEPLNPDQIRIRRSLARRVSMYKKVFPAEIAELGSELDDLIHKSPEELAALLEEVQFLVETRRSTAQARGLFVAGLSMGEAAGASVGLCLKGLTATAASSEEILRTVDECALKYEGVVAPLDPALRLAMAVGQLVLAIDASNRALLVNNHLQPAPIEAEAFAPAPIEAKASATPTNHISREEYRDL